MGLPKVMHVMSFSPSFEDSPTPLTSDGVARVIGGLSAVA